MASFCVCLRYPLGLMTEHPPEDRLDSWKEIAAYLGRGIRTVQRWEQEEGLPVHRLAHEKRGSIYERREELAAWWESRRLTLSRSEPDDGGAPVAPRLERVTSTLAMTSWPALSSMPASLPMSPMVARTARRRRSGSSRSAARRCA